MSDSTRHLHLLLGDEYPDLKVRMPDGSEPTFQAHDDVMSAYAEANDLTSAGVYREDLRLDMEECSGIGGAQRALGIVVRALLVEGYTLTVSLVESRYVDSDAPAEPGDTRQPAPWSCYACQEVLARHAPYSASCVECLGPRRHYDGGPPPRCTVCGGELSILCGACEDRERRWAEGEVFERVHRRRRCSEEADRRRGPKPPKPMGDA